MASNFVSAQVRAKRMGLTADVLMRDSQSSAGYWDVVQDALADLVRIMLLRCYDQQKNPAFLLARQGPQRTGMAMRLFEPVHYDHCGGMEIPTAVLHAAVC